MSNYTMHQIPLEERPRERLLRHGPEGLSTAELIAIILGSGTRGKTVLDLAHELLSHFGSLSKLADASIEELCQIKGLGKAKAIQLKATFSVGVKLSKQPLTPRYRIDSPLHVYNLLKEELENEKQERVVVVLQDIRGYVIGCETVSLGTLTQALIHPREVFYPAIRHKAAGLILAHNHPSGDPTPSAQDFAATQSILEAGKMLDIALHDHLVIGREGFVSIREELTRRGKAFAA
jgi:DNA repair protein RadC